MKTLREFIDQLDEISRRDFVKGAGAAALGAVASTKSDKAQAEYTLSDYDTKSIMYAAFYVYFSMVEGAKTKGPAAAIKSGFKDISGFLGYDIGQMYIDIAIKKLNGLYQSDRNQWNDFQQKLSTIDAGINLANKVQKVKDNIIYSMSAAERRHHMNRLGIKEDNNEDPIAKIDRLFKE